LGWLTAVATAGGRSPDGPDLPAGASTVDFWFCDYFFAALAVARC
jgi:hypothetical protein